MTEFTIDIPGIMVSRFREEHMEGILDLMNKEGWYYYDRHELNRYLDLGQDCFTLLENRRVLGSIFTTNYGNQAWIGNIVVAKEARGRGLASGMIRSVMHCLRKEKQILTFRLAAVPLAIGLYKRIGFHPESFSTAQEAQLPFVAEYEDIRLDNGVAVEELEEDDLDAVCGIDERYFKSNRRQLIEAIYSDSIKNGCFCLKDRKKLVGFIMLRRRQASRSEGRFAEGPDHVFRLGPSCVLPEYGVDGFKALFQRVVPVVNEEVRQLGCSARIYAVFSRSANKTEIYADTRELARAMGMDANMDLERVFDEHDLIFGAPESVKNGEQWAYMKKMGFHQEYFEQVMSYSPETDASVQKTRADTEGIFASATPGDKA